MNRTDDFALEQVPEQARVGGLRIVLVLMSGGIALPILMLGGRLGVDLGLSKLIVTAIAGGAVLGTVALLTALCGARRQLTTYALVVEAYGERGGKVINILLASSIWGWIGVNAAMFGETLSRALPGTLAGVPVAVWTIAGTIVTTAIAVIGFRAMNRLALAIVPLKVALLLTMFWKSAPHATPYAIGANDCASCVMPLSMGISAVIGAFIVGAIMLPDLARFARTPRHAAVAGVGVYGVGFPLIVLAAGIPAVWLGQSDILSLMSQLGLGLSALLIVMLAAVSTNTINLYSGSLLLSTVFQRQPRWLLATLGAVIGTTLGLLGITQYLVPWFVQMGMYVPALAGVYISAQLFASQRPTVVDWRWDAFFSAALGALAAYGAQRLLPDVAMAAAVGALLVSMLSLYFCRRAKSKRIWTSC